MTQLASTSDRPGPSPRRNWLSCASAGAAANSNSANVVRILSFLRDFDIDPLHHVVVITGGIEDQIEGLRGAGAVGRLGHEGEASAPLRRQAMRPLAPGKSSQVGCELGGAPGPAAIVGDVHAG